MSNTKGDGSYYVLYKGLWILLCLIQRVMDLIMSYTMGDGSYYVLYKG